MSTVVARTVAATPQRTASKTWARIVELLAPDAKSDARAELEKVKGVAASSIASEATKSDPFVVYGGGPRVRVYCAFGEDAINGDGVNEEPLAESPMGTGWQLSIPCPPEDLNWSRNQLEAISARATARATGKDVDGESDASPNEVSASDGGAQIDVKEFFRK